MLLDCSLWCDVASHYLTTLRPYKQIGPGVLATIASSFPNVTTVDLRGCARIDAADVEVLLSSRRLRRLRTIDVSLTRLHGRPFGGCEIIEWGEERRMWCRA